MSEADHAMVAGDAEKVRLRCSDGFVSMRRSSAESCGTLRDWLSCIEEDEPTFPVPADARTAIVACNLLEGPKSEAARRVLGQDIGNNPSSQSLSQLFSVIRLADFLAAEELIDTIGIAIACRLNGKWDVELRDVLDVRCDLSMDELDKHLFDLEALIKLEASPPPAVGADETLQPAGRL